MNREEWIGKARENKVVLRKLIADWHPTARKPEKKVSMSITAPSAEQACERIREDIRRRNLLDAPAEFDAALAAENLDTLVSLLNEAWFGVPESTSCWSLTGFAEAV